MKFIPDFPLEVNTLVLFGIILLLGLIGGELFRRIPFLPRISGYIAIGFLLGPGCFNIVSPSVLITARIFVDISLGIILFDLGRHLDFTWLRYDRGILPMSIAESGLTFTSVCLICHYLFKLPWLPSSMAASFAMATSPAVVMMVANDLSSEGPVTRRSLMLTSLNNFFALVTFTTLLPITLASKVVSNTLFSQISYMLIGSFILGVIMFLLTQFLAFLVGKRAQNQFLLFIGVLIFTIGIAQLLLLPIALSLFIFGVATRNFDKKHKLMEFNFGWTARLFFILLFVITGIHLRLDALKYAAISIIIFILVRSFSKILGIWLLSRASRITLKQVVAITLSLTPMAGLAISMSNVLNDFNPEINRQIASIIAAVVAILEIIGPIATQFAFISTGEAHPDQSVRNMK